LIRRFTPIRRLSTVPLLTDTHSPSLHITFRLAHSHCGFFATTLFSSISTTFATYDYKKSRPVLLTKLIDSTLQLEQATTHSTRFTTAYTCYKSTLPCSRSHTHTHIYNTISTSSIISSSGLRNMVFSTTTILGAMLAIAPLAAHAHIIMASPVPFGPAGSFPKQDPLTAEMFPCQNTPSTGAMVNKWTAGSNTSINLLGSAVHSGGSCQVSVTKDKSPTKDSVWRVIHSWEGGCPDVPPGGGNFMPADAKAVRPPLPFTIPTELPDGEMTMAWTWSNKVGNREFYMNCAAVEISGGAKDDTEFDALPEMAVNIDGVGKTPCKSVEDHDYSYENPGKYVTRNGTGPYMPLCGGASTPGGFVTPGGAGGAPAAGGSAPAAPANPGIPSPAVPVIPSPVASASVAASGSMGAPAGSVSPAPSAASGAQTSTLRTIVTVTASQGPPPAGVTPVSPPASAAPSASGATPPSAPASPSQAPGAAVSACSPDGAIICSPDGTQFALCNHGKAVFQAVAGGTTCTGGKIARRQDPSTMRTVYA